MEGKGAESGASVRSFSVCGGCVWDSPVGQVVTAGEVEVLQAAEAGRGLGHAPVAEPGAAAERQAGEAAAAPRHRHQAGVRELAQHGQGQPLQVGLLDHLEDRPGDAGMSTTGLGDTRTHRHQPPTPPT